MTCGLRFLAIRDQIPDILGKRWTTGRTVLAESPPVIAKALALPCNNGAGLDERQGSLPARPQARQPPPEQTIGGTEVYAVDRALVYGELMPHRECSRCSEARDRHSAVRKAKMAEITGSIIRDLITMGDGRSGGGWGQSEDMSGKSQGCLCLRVFGTDTLNWIKLS
jgi:hypothetical protein